MTAKPDLVFNPTPSIVEAWMLALLARPKQDRYTICVRHRGVLARATVVKPNPRYVWEPFLLVASQLMWLGYERREPVDPYASDAEWWCE